MFALSRKLYVGVGILIVAGLLAVGHVQSVSAQGTSSSSGYEEAVQNFTSRVVVNTDNSVDVTETIVYQTGSLERHGIYRDIRTSSSQGRKMQLSNITVTDENQAAYRFSTNADSSEVRIKIGDPDRTFSGVKTYVVKYNASNAVGQTDTFDEIYWNVTGNNWEIPIYGARAEIVLPQGVEATQSACYFGPNRSTLQCDKPIFENGAYIFDESDRTFSTQEGLTVAVGFAKGIMPAYSIADGFWDRFGSYILGGAIVLLTFLLCFAHWYKKGRDDRETGTIIPQYDIEGGLTPMEAAGIALEKINAQQLSSQIIYLATHGYIKLVEEENVMLGFIKSKKYQFIELKSDYSALKKADKQLMTGLFQESSSVTPSGQRVVTLEDLQNEFYTTAAKIEKTTADTLKAEGYYKNLGSLKGMSVGSIVGFIFLLIWASGFFGSIIGAIIGTALPIIVAVFLSVLIFGIFRYLSPSKTHKGVAAKEQILGLKEYLQIAEKDRMEFHNAPERRPETFEKLLPYAMALGVADVWAKEFEDIYTAAPGWYQGPHGAAFNVIAFNTSLNAFSAAAVTSMASSPHSSGSGGGGFSGGGGGGGGGGGW